MPYKISMRINIYCKYYFIKDILRKYKNIIKDCSICIITTPTKNIIRYLEIYIYHMINIEDFFNICIDLNVLKNSLDDNIKMRDIVTKDIIYTIKPYFNMKKKDGVAIRKYSKINL